MVAAFCFLCLQLAFAKGLSQSFRQPPAWAPCSFAPALNYTDAELSCANVSVPVNYSKPQGMQTWMHVIRLQPLVAASAAVWLIPGGPGGTGYGMLDDGYGELFARAGSTVYSFDHRGTGLSEQPRCQDGGQTLPLSGSCLDYMIDHYGREFLQSITTDNAVVDLGEVMRAVQGADPLPTCIYGQSYGTVIVERLMARYPGLVQCSIQDGVINPLTASLGKYDLFAERTGRMFLDHCTQDSFCGGLFNGQYPDEVLRQVLQQYNDFEGCAAHVNFTRDRVCAGPCAGGRTLEFCLNMQYLFEGKNYHKRVLIPAMMYRFQRCSADHGDIAAWNKFLSTCGVTSQPAQKSQLPPPQPDPQEPGFFMLQNIIICDLYKVPGDHSPSEAQVLEWLASPWARGNRMDQWKRLWDQRALCTPASPRNVAPEAPGTRSLMVNGGLDPATVFPEAAALHRLAPWRHFVAVPLMGHVSLDIALPPDAARGSIGTCMKDLFVGFSKAALANQSWHPPACLEELPLQLDWRGSSKEVEAQSIEFIGTADLYGLTVPSPPTLSPRLV